MWSAIRDRRATERDAPPVRATARDGPVPLSPAQHRLWLLCTAPHGNPPGYNVTLARRLVGPLDRDAFGWAVRRLVKRHEALRTVFAEREGVLLQWVQQDLAPEVVFIDRDRSGISDRATSGHPQIARWLQAEATHRFDLRNGPLIRASLLSLSPQEHLLVLCTHHIISDGWSLGVLVEELAGLYRARITGQPPKLALVRLHMPDFVLWLQEWLRGETLARYLRFWRDSGVVRSGVSPLVLPPDRPIPPRRSYAGKRVPIEVPPELTTALRDLATRAGITLFVVLLAAFQAVLHLSGGPTDITVGTPSANRNRSELAKVVGYIATIVPMRAHIEDDPQFRQLLDRVSSVVSASFAYQALSVEALLAHDQPERDLVSAYPITTLFALHNFKDRGLDLIGIKDEPLHLDVKDTEFAISLSLFDNGARLPGYLSYQEEVYGRDLVTDLGWRYCRFLAQAAETPERRISALMKAVK